MLQDDRALLFAKEAYFKDAGRCFVLSRRAGAFDPQDGCCCGRLLTHQRSGAFTLELPRAQGHACAFAFFGLGARFRGAQALRIVIPRRPPHRPSSDVELLNMATIGSTDRRLFAMMASRLPVPGADGKVAVQFPPGSFVIPSIKNFLIEDDAGRVAFSICRSSSETCSVHCCEPITPIIAFALAVAIVASYR
jgi:hypothetical protein